MPSTSQIGSPGPANDRIGGVPTIHYFDFFSRGRGQVVRLLFEDAGIAYVDVRYSFEEFPKVKQDKFINGLNPTGNVPVVELNGKTLTQSYAILRHFARVLGAYDGKTEEEKFWVDRVCDIAIDWRTLFIIAFFDDNQDETYPKHCKDCRPRFLHALESHLSKHPLSATSKSESGGPFVLGDTITYADLVIYQVCHDEQLTKEGRKGLKDFPRLKELVDGVEGRPRIKAWLASDRYLG